jgi:hypothetical protein
LKKKLILRESVRKEIEKRSVVEGKTTVFEIFSFSGKNKRKRKDFASSRRQKSKIPKTQKRKTVKTKNIT